MSWLRRGVSAFVRHEAVGDDEIYRLVHRPVLYVTADSRLVLGGDDIPAIWQAIR